MSIAYNTLRPGPHYRREAFDTGLAAAGYDVKNTPPGPCKRGDVLCIWNRYGTDHDLAKHFEAGGGKVLVAENGYIGRDGSGMQLYALARGGHNGSGTWPEGGPERWTALGVPVAPWRARGAHILLCPNRTFGMPGLAMPAEWLGEVRRKLQKMTKREVRYRPHPMNHAPKPLDPDLSNCHVVIIWASSIGVHALVAGVPVIAASPYWICKAASGRLEDIENPPIPDRLPVLERLAHAQWTLAEIASGEPFRRLLAV